MVSVRQFDEKFIWKPLHRGLSFPHLIMEKHSRGKGKNKKAAPKAKTPKKRTSEGPTCSLFLAELTRKLASKKKEEEEKPKNIIQTIIESITNALPIKLSRRTTPPKKESPMKIETLQKFAPELVPKNTVEIVSIPNQVLEIIEAEKAVDNVISMTEVSVTETIAKNSSFKIPKMPLVNSEVLKNAIEKRKKSLMKDASMNTNTDHDIAAELTKHVGTLRKISLIAEEFNKKTAKNLKEIVDSVQEELIQKLEEIKAKQKPGAVHIETVRE
ncbi:uncharacterized protein LOC114240074 [Bombyx mandarina]|uniref:Uncharacterized protein LOC114240074 n=1 Tax=Bombyx mandarina TaxID=7092 RepID=A0A6J2JA00_BOMMA|nr:uncharacterized protein LOC114240074 [Bombyx mandarina]